MNVEDNKETPEMEKTNPKLDEEKKEQTLDEILASNPKLQSEYDKKVASSIETATNNAKSKWDKEQADKVAESQKLAQMDEIQKKDYEIETLKRDLAERDAKQQASDLMTEAIKLANEKGIPLEVMTALNYRNETAESIKNKIEIYSKAFQTTRTSAIEEYSKESSPKVGDYKGETKDISKMSYEELSKLPEYK